MRTRSRVLSYVLMLMAPDPDPAGGGGGGPPPTPPTPPADPPVDPDDKPITMTSKQLKERLDRATSSARTGTLKDLGFKDEAEAKAVLERDKKRAEDDEKRRQEQLSTEQRLAEQAATEKASREAAERARDEATQSARVARACAKLGVTNLDYAEFALSKRGGEVAKGGDAAIEGWLAEQLKGSDAAAFAAKPPATVVDPVTTTPGGDPPPTPPAPGGPAPGSTDAFKLDEAAWAEKRAALGLQ